MHGHQKVTPAVLATMRAELEGAAGTKANLQGAHAIETMTGVAPAMNAATGGASGRAYEGQMSQLDQTITALTQAIALASKNPAALTGGTTSGADRGTDMGNRSPAGGASM
jgi:uncharacterized protein YukE